MAEQRPNSPPEGEPVLSPGPQSSGTPGEGGQGAEGREGTGPSSSSSVENDPVQLRAELAEAKDLALRGWAELENYRKRASRQLDEERRYAAMPLVRDVLPVLDNMKRAVEAAEKTHDAASLLEGIHMVVQQLEGALARNHCTPIAALHGPFDPNVHEAILHQPSAEFPPNTVLQETLQGFLLHDRVVRPTQVIVSSPAEQPRAEGDEG